MSHRLTRKPGRLVVGLLSALALVGGLVAAPSLATASPRGSDEGSKIAAEVAGTLADGASASFWVRFARQADLAPAERVVDWDARGQAVYDALHATAESSQGSVKALLDERGATYESFFITNAIFVKSGTMALATEIARHAEVAQILPSPEYSIPEPEQWDEGTLAPDAIEWGVQNIKAPQVWSDYGDRGQKIVVALIDTGVQYNHPALVNQYRGKRAGGSFNHNYNWFDASGSTTAPFDSQGHGTHVMGTMVGDDGGSNQIGVAPKAKWIATNGCHTCAFEDLIESGEWLLAPTKLNGTKPKVKKRPHVINNSWGIPFSTDPFMEDVLIAWEASGIFGMWAIGNEGESCSTVRSPGGRIVAYSTGATDINNNIADFSSRGPGQGSEVKPNLAAPGVNVRSSIPGSGYGNSSGTSMASPHVSGAIALLWSEVPSVKRDIDATRELLDDTAINVSDLSCGGTADDNNVWGEGRLDAKALVDAGVALAKR